MANEHPNIHRMLKACGFVETSLGPDGKVAVTSTTDTRAPVLVDAEFYSAYLATRQDPVWKALEQAGIVVGMDFTHEYPRIVLEMPSISGEINALFDPAWLLQFEKSAAEPKPQPDYLRHDKTKQVRKFRPSPNRRGRIR